MIKIKLICNVNYLHLLFYLHIYIIYIKKSLFIRVVKNQITGIYHGVCKRDLPLFLKEQEYRINHRYVGKGLMAKIQKYIYQSSPVPKKVIIRSLDLAKGYFTPDFA